MAKATAAEAVREQETIDTASALLGTCLRTDKVLHWLNAISPTAARMSAETYHNDSIPTLNVLGHTQNTVTAVDQADDYRIKFLSAYSSSAYRTKDRGAYSSLHDWGIDPNA